jgi:D-alanyl-D-alanine carboxypeptidase/D-alanyl-D-alanine-endopeptidase (penicillin-binding protein 4)
MTKMQGFFIFLLVFKSQAVMSASEPLSKAIARQVESSRLKPAQLGLVVADHEGQIVYQLNGDKKMIPASLTKILTAAAALEKLPVGFKLETHFRARSEQVKGARLEGDLYLVGGGDAGFVSESLWFLVNEFVRTGVTEVTGDLVVDDSHFDSVRFDESRDQERVDRAYDAPIGAMTFNWSAVNVFVRPGVKVGDAARVFADPENRYFTVVNKAKTVAAGKKSQIEVRNSSVGRSPKNNSDGAGGGLVPQEELVITGSIPVGGAEFVAFKSITQPEAWAGYNAIEFLRQRGVLIRGRVRSGRAPTSVQVLARYKSKPVQELVAGMMKFSNNYIAEILTKNLGAEVKGEPGTMDKGIEVLRDYLREHQIADAEVYNPSGLSRKNRFRPLDLLKILIEVKSDVRLYPEYLASLPIAGVDGTLRSRLNGQKRAPGAGNVRAKTGHLSGVAGLGGYVGGQSGQLYSFVFLFNGSADDGYKSKQLFDAIILELGQAD